MSVEQAQLAELAPGEELAQVEGVRLTGAAALADQETGEGHDFSIRGAGVVEDEGRGVRHGGSPLGREPGSSRGGSRPARFFTVEGTPSTRRADRYAAPHRERPRRVVR